MAELKTKRTRESVQAFIAGIEDESRRADARAVLKIMREATGEKPQMWGPSIVGFGSYHFKYESGREGDWFLTGFSPRKQALTIYIMAGFAKYESLMAKLGKHTTGKSCLYIKKLADVDPSVLRKLIEQSVAHLRKGQK